jgi:hypothetical protein
MGASENATTNWGQAPIKTAASPSRKGIATGFSLLTPEQRRENARRGGIASQASGRAHRFTSEEGRAAAQKKIRVNREARSAA